MTTQYAIPAVGSKVRFTVRTREPLLHAGSDFRVTTYEGTVLVPEKFVPATSFCVTGNKDCKVRQVPISLVEDLEYLDGTVAAKVEVGGIEIKQVPGSKPGVFYTVTIDGNKKTCSCPGFTFRKTCRHVEQ